MIQRIQSIYLFVAALFIGLLFLFPYIEVGDDDFYVQEYLPQIIFSVIFIIGAIGTIFLYRDRPLQLRNIRILILFFLAIVGYGIYEVALDQFKDISIEIGSFLLLFAGYFLFKAGQNIKKDERLVNDSDRLR